MKLTQKKKILAIMIQGRHEWWHGEDVMSYRGIFIGYKAPTRLSELGLEYPEMLQREPSHKGNGQFMYRFRFENTANFMPTLPIYLRVFVREQLERHGRELKEYRQEPVYSEDGRSVLGFKRVEKVAI